MPVAGQSIKLIGTGNRCGHHPSLPRSFAPPTAHKARPIVIKRAISQLIRYYEKPALWLTNLRGVNASTRQQRSERREAIMAVLGVLLHYVDLDTLKVGTPGECGRIHGLRLAFIASKAGLQASERGAPAIKRTWLALDDLRRAGYLHRERRIINVKDRVLSQCMYTLKPIVFTHLGIQHVTLEKSRALKRKSQAKRASQGQGKWRRPGFRGLNEIMGAIAGAKPKKATTSPKKTQQNKDADVHAMRHYMAEVLRLHHAQGLSMDEAKRCIPFPRTR